MRVCQITNLHPWDDDRIFQRACLGLARLGHQVVLIATAPSTPIDESKYPIKFVWLENTANSKKRIVSARQPMQKAKEVDAEIYHFHEPEMLLYARELKKSKPKSVVIYDIHENYAARFKMWGIPKLIAGILSTFYRNYEISVINNIDGFICVSESQLTLFAKANKPGIVVRNSADLERLRHLKFPEPNEDKIKAPIIYTSGTNSHARNCLQAVQALPLIISKHSNVKMMFVGMYEGNINEEMTEQARKDSSLDNLTIDGMMPWDQNFIRTSGAFCGCVFYADNPNNRIGIPNRIFEYMYCGIPVVATNFPELARIVNDTQCGVLVNSEDPRSIADGINKLLENPAEAQAMGLRGKKAIEEKYGFHVDMRNMISFYENLVSRVA